MLNKNSVILVGRLASDLIKNHTAGDETFYETSLHVERNSARSSEGEAVCDHIPLMVSELALVPLRGASLHVGQTVRIEGELRIAVYLTNEVDPASGNYIRRHELYILVTTVLPQPDNTPHYNHITLSGSIIRKAHYKSGYTPDGHVSESSSLSISVPFGSIDRTVYITILSNGRVARSTQFLILGDELLVEGRLRLEDRTIQPKEPSGTVRNLRVGYVVASGITVTAYAKTSDDVTDTDDAVAADTASIDSADPVFSNSSDSTEAVGSYDMVDSDSEPEIPLPTDEGDI